MDNLQIIELTYSTLRDILDRFYMNGDVIGNDCTLEMLFDHANSDVAKQNWPLRQSALLTLDLLYKCKWKNLTVNDIPDVYITLAFNSITKDGQDIREIVLNCMQCVIQQLVVSDKFDVEKLLLKVDNEDGRKKILELLQRVIIDLPMQRGLIFFYDGIMPTIFNTSSTEVRGSLLEFASNCLPRFVCTLLSEEKLLQFKNYTKTSFLQTIMELQKQADPHWHQLWIFLIQCYNKILLCKNGVLNSFLKILEVPLGKGITEQRILAYDCWKVLIDIYGLDNEEMCDQRHIKLLITPLRTVTSTNTQVTKKRFEVWAHMISVLKKNLFLYLPHFLQFCFGPFNKLPLSNRGNPNKGSLARNDFELRQQSAGALSEMMGHYGHDPSLKCLDYTYNSIFNLDEPLINSSNFIELDFIIINSIGECCSLALNWMDKHSKIQFMRCLWGSLFNIIKQLKESDQDATLQKVTELLTVYVELSNEIHNYFHYILQPIFELLLKERLFDIDVVKFTTLFMFPILKEFVKQSDALFPHGKTTILQVVHITKKNTSDKDIWFEQVFDILCSIDVKRINFKVLLKLWKECAEIMIDSFEFSHEGAEHSLKTSIVDFMIWPLYHLHKTIPEDTQDTIKEFTGQWGCTFECILKSSTTDALMILDELKNKMKTTPFIAENTAELYFSFTELLKLSQYHNNVLANKILALTSQLLAVSSLTKQATNLVVPTVSTIIEFFIKEQKMEKSDFLLLSQCFEHFLSIHKKFPILLFLERYFNKIPITYKTPTTLHRIVNDLAKHKNERVAEKARSVLLKIGSLNTEETFLQPCHVQTSRAAKITQMARTSPTVSGNIEETSSTVSLFGHRVKPPLNINSSIHNESISRKRKAANAFMELEKAPVNSDVGEGSSGLLDVQYEFDHSGLTDPQLEVLKKRKFDIPTYPDLSYSQSNYQMMDIEEIQKVSPKDVPEGKVENILEDLFQTKAKPNAKEEILEIKQHGPLNDPKNHINSAAEDEDVTTIEPNQLRIDLTIQNPSMNKIAALINDDQLKNIVSDMDNNSNETLANSKEKTEPVLSKAQKKQQRIKNEMRKLQMDVVGGDKFIQCMDLSKRMTRSTDLNNSHMLRSGSKLTYDSDDSKSSTSSDGGKRSKLGSVCGNDKKNSNRKSAHLPVKRCLCDELHSHKKTKNVQICNSNKITSASLAEFTTFTERQLLNSSEEKDSDFTVTLVNDSKMQNSEDIIDSSQESFVAISPCHIITPKNSLENVTKPIDKYSKDVDWTSSENTEICPPIESFSDEKKTNQNFSEPTQDIEENLTNDVSIYSADEIIRRDLSSPKPIELNTCEMDTETAELETELGTPEKLKIPSSPIHSNTPTRTSELITNTINISPIKKEENTPSVFESEAAFMSEYIQETIVDNEHYGSVVLANNENNPTTVVIEADATTPTTVVIEADDKTTNSNDIIAIPNILGSRGEKLLSMISNTSPSVNHHIRKPTPLKMSQHTPIMKTGRIMKMMQTCEKNLDEPWEVENSNEPLVVFGYEKGLPDPSATPNHSILKRKPSDTREERVSPPRKRRVNFSDPLLTRRRHYKEDEQSEENVKICYEDIIYYTPNKSNLQVPNQESISKTNEEICTSPTTEMETESLNLETQGSIDITNPYFLDYNEPIVPELVHCKEGMNDVLLEITSPLLYKILQDELQKRNIFTIGDLAQLSEVDVIRLPLQKGKVQVLRNALYKYCTCESNTRYNEYNNVPRDQVGIRLIGETDEGEYIETTCIIIERVLERNTNEEESMDKSEDEEDYNGIPICEESENQFILIDSDSEKDMDNGNNIVDGSNVELISGEPLLTVTNLPDLPASSTKSPVQILQSIIVNPANSILAVDSVTSLCNGNATKNPVEAGSSEDCKNTICEGTSEEREKLQISMSELIADFQKLREKVRRQGLSATSLYELILEVVGTDDFVSVLRECRALSINHLVKNDNDWCAVIAEIIHNIGLNKMIFCLCRIPKVTPPKLVNKIFDYIAQYEEKNRSCYLEKISNHVLNSVPVPTVLRMFGMRCIIDSLREMNQAADFTVEEFFQHATFRFSPNIDDIISSFKNINIVQMNNQTVELSNSVKNDLNEFVKRITILVKPTAILNNTIDKEVAEISVEDEKENMALNLFNEISIGKQEQILMHWINKVSVERQEELIITMVDKMPLSKRERLMQVLLKKVSS